MIKLSKRHLCSINSNKTLLSIWSSSKVYYTNLIFSNDVMFSVETSSFNGTLKQLGLRTHRLCVLKMTVSILQFDRQRWALLTNCKNVYNCYCIFHQHLKACFEICSYRCCRQFIAESITLARMRASVSSEIKVVVLQPVKCFQSMFIDNLCSSVSHFGTLLSFVCKNTLNRPV